MSDEIDWWDSFQNICLMFSSSPLVTDMNQEHMESFSKLSNSKVARKSKQTKGRTAILVQAQWQTD